MVQMDGVGGDRVDDALAFRRIVGEDEEAHQYGWCSRSRRTRCARPCDEWPGRPCRRELSAGPVACTHILEGAEIMAGGAYMAPRRKSFSELAM